MRQPGGTLDVTLRSRFPTFRHHEGGTCGRHGDHKSLGRPTPLQNRVARCPQPRHNDRVSTGLDHETLLAQWRAEEREQPGGWSFADLTGRVTEDAAPWDFTTLTAAAAAGADRWLDLGTGGGEWLEQVLAGLDDARRPATVRATEGWEPNVAVAQETLRPHGIDVVAFGQPDDDPAPAPMPFPDGSFDLITSRHESYHPAEIARVLAPGGRILTQQVGGDELGELRALLDYPPATPWVRHTPFTEALGAAGLEVTDGLDWQGHYTFTDVAALVAYLQRVPWDAPADFTVDRYAAHLLALHQRHHGGPIPLTMKRFWIEARRAQRRCQPATSVCGLDVDNTDV